MFSNKKPVCKICGGAHYKMACYKAPKKALKSKSNRASSTIKKPLKKAVFNPQSRSLRQLLVRKLDIAFSTYIRRKDALNGIAKCVTCGETRPWREMQNGHYISRRVVQLRWDEINCHVQCSNCNTTLNGNLVKYKQYMYRKYGAKGMFYLQQKQMSTNKILTSELQALLDEYKTKIDNLPENA